MSDITKTNLTLPKQMRSERTPQTGDIYIHSTSGYEEFIRLGTKHINGDNTSFERETWSFINSGWEPHRFDISERELAEHYQLCLVPFEEVITSTDKMFRGEPIENTPAESDTTELVLHGNALPSLLSQTEMLEDRLKTVTVALKARINEEHRLMEARLEPLKALVDTTKKQLLNIRRAISIVEIYQGVNVEVVSLTEGCRADKQIPVSIRQRILFMDEECAVLDEEGQGLDYWSRDRFYDWIKTPSHRDIILPEQKCVVVMKPRRFHKQYSCDAYTQRLINEWNRHSFVFIRNGENISVIESDDLCIYDAVIPRKADYEKISEEANTWRESAQNKMEDINYRCMHFAMVLQGINDRTDIFSPHGDINFLKNIGSQIVFDDESDSLVGTGRPDFKQWLKEQSKTIRKGSRILYVRGFSEGQSFRDDPHGYNWNHPSYRGPSVPETGLYSVIEKPHFGLGFTYLPNDEIWNQEEGYHKRKRRETWLFDREKVLNFDTVKGEDLAAYLADRGQRRYYQGIIPTLRRYQMELQKESEYENLFVSALSKVLDEKNIAHASEDLQNALKWWKNKVIQIRPISSDDKKAWRMIIEKVKREQKEKLEHVSDDKRDGQ